ncbi:uncharacterized protein LOC100562734 isoform X2 [Anolis carolinensis]|uniref:uncharacterized protein LOC100562734 isoform X2 n=1 Tax=Anolis carolinensis TaxID=28377 RepID=UPI0004628E1D|nr:PREDICTED: uncharacterized protein LOC100562734 [Anolis carolinensis]|eukprot:XP_008101442.1 PREDICTED: uncharacterized protein LOC100562734 [Anolis carolinensis]
MSQLKEDEPTNNGEKSELFPLNCKVSELLLAHRCLKWGQEKDLSRVDVLESHASLFHSIRSILKAWKKTAENDKAKRLEVKKSSGISLASLQVQDFVKEHFDFLKDRKEDKDTRRKSRSKSISRPGHSRHPLMSKRKGRKADREELPPTRLLPYFSLIRNCFPLPLSIIQSLCLSREIQCRIERFTQKRRKKEEVTQLGSEELPMLKLQTIEDPKYITFSSLRELQWKLFKGLVKRKPGTIGIWRVPLYSSGIGYTMTPHKQEYVLPLIPKDWIIDDSLKFSEEMTHRLLQYNPPS